ncbi:MAG: serine hydrolase domain-containing protein [Bacteroidota bacterium]
MSFDFKKFADAIENDLKGNCVGYAFVVSHKEVWREKRAGGKARTSRNVPPTDMNTDIRFHTASVSKAITGAALLRALYHNKDFSLGTPFHTLLPRHWRVHQSITQLTFEQLLTHRAGFRFSGGGLSYASLKENIERGINTADIGDPEYQGENFAVMRLLIPRLSGYDIPQVQNADSLFETMQAGMYAASLIDYTNKHLFGKSGLSKLGCKPVPFLGGICYHFPYDNKSGTEFSDQTLVVGSKGWVMSAAEMGRFFRTLHFTEEIMPNTLSTRMKNDLLGYDSKGSTSEGVGYYWKNGQFPGSQNDGELNTLIIGYDNEVQVALIINSELGGGKGMVSIINDAHDEAYKMVKIKADDIKRIKIK